jgi:hypothetical protein
MCCPTVTDSPGDARQRGRHCGRDCLAQSRLKHSTPQVEDQVMTTSADSQADRWFAVGSSRETDYHQAGAEAARAAQEGRRAALLVVFCPSLYESDSVLAGVCSVTSDDVLIIGGTAMGEIAPAVSGSAEMGDPRAVVVAALGGPGFSIRDAVVRDASGDRRAVGAQAASATEGLTDPHQALLMIADGLTREQHELVRGAYSVLGAEVPIVGGCTADEVRYELTRQFHGTGAGVEQLSDSIVAVGLGSNAPLGVGVCHGWEKQGEPMVVTSSSGGELFLLDDKPALDVYLDRIGATRSLLDDQQKFSAVTLQHPLGLSRRNGQDLRVVHSGDPDRGSLLCLADVPQGALAWSMSAKATDLVDAASQSCQMAVDGLGGLPPLGLLVFDCGARKLKFDPEELKAEQEAIARVADGAPFAGFYTYGEIARTKGSRGMHHLTVVALALA